MGPAGLTNPTTNVVGGQTDNYTVGDAAINGAWSAHGILSHFRVTAGSVSTNRYVRMSDVTDGTTSTLLLAERAVVLPGSLNDYRSGTTFCGTRLRPRPARVGAAQPRRRTLATGIHALRSLDADVALGILPALVVVRRLPGRGQPLPASPVIPWRARVFGGRLSPAAAA